MGVCAHMPHPHRAAVGHSVLPNVSTQEASDDGSMSLHSEHLLLPRHPTLCGSQTCGGRSNHTDTLGWAGRTPGPTCPDLVLPTGKGTSRPPTQPSPRALVRKGAVQHPGPGKGRGETEELKPGRGETKRPEKEEPGRIHKQDHSRWEEPSPRGKPTLVQGTAPLAWTTFSLIHLLSAISHRDPLST